MFGTAPSAREDATVFCAGDGFDPELAGHVAVDILPWSVHCTVGRSRGRRTIRLAAFGCDAGGAACVRQLAFAELFMPSTLMSLRRCCWTCPSRW